MKNFIRMLVPMYWFAARAYWGAMIRNGCTDQVVLAKYIRAVSAINDL